METTQRNDTQRNDTRRLVHTSSAVRYGANAASTGGRTNARFRGLARKGHLHARRGRLGSRGHAPARRLHCAQAELEVAFQSEIEFEIEIKFERPEFDSSLFSRVRARVPPFAFAIAIAFAFAFAIEFAPFAVAGSARQASLGEQRLGEQRQLQRCILRNDENSDDAHHPKREHGQHKTKGIGQSQQQSQTERTQSQPERTQTERTRRDFRIQHETDRHSLQEYQW